MTSDATDATDRISVKTFEEVDESGESAEYIKVLDEFDAIEGMQTLKRIARERAGIRAGMSVFDDGCGTGLETARLARLVGQSGRTVGLDMSRALLCEAQRREAASHLAIDYLEGDAGALPFARASFDVARAERLLLYLEAPAKALAELVRITKPGGIVYVIEPDFETVTINLTDRDLVRKALHFDCDHDTRNGWIGRQLPGMLKAAGLIEVNVATSVIIFPSQSFSSYFLGIGSAALRSNALTADEAQRWQQGILDLLRQDQLFCTITYFMMMGTVTPAGGSGQ